MQASAVVFERLPLVVKPIRWKLLDPIPGEILRVTVPRQLASSAKGTKRCQQACFGCVNVRRAVLQHYDSHPARTDHWCTLLSCAFALSSFFLAKASYGCCCLILEPTRPNPIDPATWSGKIIPSLPRITHALQVLSRLLVGFGTLSAFRVFSDCANSRFSAFRDGNQRTKWYYRYGTSQGAFR